MTSRNFFSFVFRKLHIFIFDKLEMSAPPPPPPLPPRTVTSGSAMQ